MGCMCACFNSKQIQQLILGHIYSISMKFFYLAFWSVTSLSYRLNRTSHRMLLKNLQLGTCVCVCVYTYLLQIEKLDQIYIEVMCVQEISAEIGHLPLLLGRKACTLSILTNYKCQEENNMAVFEKIMLFT